MVKVFYHNDCDGWCSAFWVRKYLEQEKISFKPEDFIEMNYDKEFPWTKIDLGEEVYMVDFSLKTADDMILLDGSSKLTWIDHHKSAIDKIDDYEIQGIQYDGIAACALTWGYLFKPDKILRDTWFDECPLFTWYVHLWDTWQWKNCDNAYEIEAFITRMSTGDVCNDPCHPIWDGLNHLVYGEDNVRTWISEGASCLHFRHGYAKGMCESTGKSVEFEGFRCFACNMGHVSSEWFKSVNKSTYDILMPFYYNVQTEQFCFSLYSSNPDIDVSKIAVKYGGGGHKGAAGFQCKMLPF